MSQTRFAFTTRRTALALAVFSAVLGTAAQAETTDTLKKIKDSGTITLGVRESSGALAYTLGNGKYVGFHTEMAERVAQDIRKKLGMSSITVKYQPVTSQNRIPLVQNGTVDLECGSTSNTLARQKQVAFSVSIFIVSTRMLVRKDAPLQEFADLAGRRAVVTAGTTSERLLRAWNETHGGRIQLLSARDHGEAFQSLETGKVDALMLDDALLLGERAKASQPEDWRLTGTPMSSEVYGCMLRRDDAGFKTLVDRELSRLMQGGEALKIYQRWFQRPIPPKGLNLNWPPTEALLQLYRQPSDRALQ